MTRYRTIVADPPWGGGVVEGLSDGDDLPAGSLDPLDQVVGGDDPGPREPVELGDDDPRRLSSLDAVDGPREDGPLDLPPGDIELRIEHADGETSSFRIRFDASSLKAGGDESFPPFPDPADAHVSQPGHPRNLSSQSCSGPKGRRRGIRLSGPTGRRGK